MVGGASRRVAGHAAPMPAIRPSTGGAEALLIVAIGLALAAQWLTVGNRASWLGWCLYTYNACQSVPVLWLGWIGLAAVFGARGAWPPWRGVLITVAGFLLAAFPWIFYVTDQFRFGDHWRLYTHMARNRQVATLIAEAWAQSGLAGALEVVGRQAGLTWLGFGVIPGGAYEMDAGAAACSIT